MVRFTSLAVVASAVFAVNAQISSDCNPLKSTCPSNPSLPASTVVDFTKISGPPDGWRLSGAGGASYDGNGAGLILAKRGDNPTLETNGYFLFGSLEVVLKAAPQQGVVTSIVMLSDTLDEIDWELIGGNNGQVQSNYFGKGDTSSYDRAAWHNLASPQTRYVNYKVDWTPTLITFYIDGAVVRTLKYNDAAGGTRFPQAPMKVRIGIWAGGDPSNGQGTVDWAGGLTDFSKLPSTMFVQSVKITNSSPGKSYTYTDKSGNLPSIKIEGGALMVAAAAAPASTSSLSTSLSLATAVPTNNPIALGANARNGTNGTITSSSVRPAATGNASTSSVRPIQANAGSSVRVAAGVFGGVFALAMALFA